MDAHETSARKRAEKAIGQLSVSGLAAAKDGFADLLAAFWRLDPDHPFGDESVADGSDLIEMIGELLAKLGIEAPE